MFRPKPKRQVLIALIAMFWASTALADPWACGQRFLSESEVVTLMPGMTRDEVIQRIGEPGCFRGHGLIYETYPLTSGRLLWLLYSTDKDARLIAAFVRIPDDPVQPLNPFFE